MVCSPVFKDAGDDDRALAIFAKHRARVVELFLDLCVDRPIEGPGPLDDAILPLFALFVSTRSDALRSRFFHKVAQLNPDGVAHCLHLAAEAGDASTAAHCITWFSEGENRGIRTYSAAALARYLAGFMPDAWKLVLYDILLGGSGDDYTTAPRYGWFYFASEFEARKQGSNTKPRGTELKQWAIHEACGYCGRPEETIKRPAETRQSPPDERAIKPLKMK